MHGVMTSLFAFLLLIVSGNGLSEPRKIYHPNRAQLSEWFIEPEQRVRIWMFYVGQGDAMLIQIPGQLVGADDTLDILVDTGAYGSKEKVLARQALDRIYPDPTTLEHLVLTHHDSDHVSGLAHILRDDKYAIPNVWHNGLASYVADAFDHSSSELLQQDAIYSTGKKSGQTVVKRFMGTYNKSNKKIASQYLINDWPTLQQRSQKGWLQGVYKALSEQIIQTPSIQSFQRVHKSSPFINVSHSEEIAITPLWPLKHPRKYGNWGVTINGNSVAFKFEYKDFSMLFTGDLNTQSERALLKEYSGQPDRLTSDVLKVPHHGSHHNLPAFIKQVDPYISVASMGKKGFETNWQHPAESLIADSGGVNRFYSTYIHEKAFDYETLKDKIAHMREQTHVLIETDGEWFRIVEIPVDFNLAHIPTVMNVEIGNGTRWIRAK